MNTIVICDNRISRCQKNYC